jgi:uncharacterized protein involved in exopolysaccharide biosynthesis
MLASIGDNAVFKIIDQARTPENARKKSVLVFSVVGFVFGLILGLFIIVVNNIVRTNRDSHI